MIVSENHLRSLIRSVLQEKIRTKKTSKKKFNFQKFKEIKNPKKMLRYLRRHLTSIKGAGYWSELKWMETGDSSPTIGGSSRIAYVLTSRYAIKAAKNKKGVVQNKHEVEMFLDLPKEYTKYFINVYDFDPDFKWIITDLVKPITIEEFEEFVEDSDWWKEVIDVHGKMGKITDDIERASANWGRTPDGRYVVLDYGVDEDILQKYYDWNRTTMFKTSEYAFEDSDDPKDFEIKGRRDPSRIRHEITELDEEIWDNFHATDLVSEKISWLELGIEKVEKRLQDDSELTLAETEELERKIDSMEKRLEELEK